jgi:hypothetical protein
MEGMRHGAFPNLPISSQSQPQAMLRPIAMSSRELVATFPGELPGQLEIPSGNSPMHSLQLRISNEM